MVRVAQLIADSRVGKKFTHIAPLQAPQSGQLLVVNGVITRRNGLINWQLGFITPTIRVITLPQAGRGPLSRKVFSNPLLSASKHRFVGLTF